MSNVISDDEFVMVVYTHGNRGQHPVSGGATKRSYGYRAGGERFLVHRDDVRAQPHLFKTVSSEKLAVAQARPAPVPPPPPVAIEPQQSEDDIDTAPLSPVPMSVQDSVLRLDLQNIPGVTPTIERSMKNARVDTVETILNAGVEGLQEIKFVGATKARLIYNYVEERYGDSK